MNFMVEHLYKKVLPSKHAKQATASTSLSICETSRRTSKVLTDLWSSPSEGT